MNRLNFKTQENKLEEFLYSMQIYIEDCRPDEISISCKKNDSFRECMVRLSKLSNVDGWLFQLARTISLHQKQFPSKKVKHKMAATITPSSPSNSAPIHLVTNYGKECREFTTGKDGIECDSSSTKDGGDNQLSFNSSNTFKEEDLAINKQAKCVPYNIIFQHIPKNHSNSRDFAPGGDDVPPGRNSPGGCQQDVQPRLEQVDPVIQFLIDLPQPTEKMIYPKFDD